VQSMSAPLLLNGGYRESRRTAPGQQATLTDASPVFELNAWSRVANRALTDQKLPLIAGT
jgi:hypothetical protein